MPLKVELVSPEAILYEGEADMVICRTAGGGDLAFMAGHVPFIGTLAGGPLAIIESSGERREIAVHRGFVEMAHNKVSILSDVAEFAGDIDVDRAKAAMDRAEEALRSNAEDPEALGDRERANTRLLVAGGTNASH